MNLLLCVRDSRTMWQLLLNAMLLEHASLSMVLICAGLPSLCGSPYSCPALQEAAKRVSTEHGHLDLLVNVAGLLHIPGKLSPGALGLLHFGCAQGLLNLGIDGTG